MKRKLFSLILALLLLPSAMLFSACKKGDGNLVGLNNKLYEIATSSETDCIVKNKNEIAFDYSCFKSGEVYYVNDVISNTYPYIYINDYNYILNNLMLFAFNYVDVCSQKELVVSAEIKERIFAEVEELKASYLNLHTDFETLASAIVFYANEQDGITNDNCMLKYKNVLYDYEELFEKAINFNNSLSEVYYNVSLYNANPNITEIELEDFNPAVVINNLQSRLFYQVSNLSKSFVQTKIIGGEVSESIANKSANFSIADLKEDVDFIKIKDIDEDKLVERANAESKKEAFFAAAAKAYNLQECLNNDMDKYSYASKQVVYLEKLNNVEATRADEYCVQIIEDYLALIGEYQNAITNMLTILEISGV